MSTHHHERDHGDRRPSQRSRATAPAALLAALSAAAAPGAAATVYPPPQPPGSFRAPWSAWRPTNSAALARHVAAIYPDLRVRRLQVDLWTRRGGAASHVVGGTGALAFEVCAGERGPCRVLGRGGEPRARRAAYETALFALRYLGANAVAVALPRMVDDPGARVLFLRVGEARVRLAHAFAL